jgi:hypothetical protein
VNEIGDTSVLLKNIHSEQVSSRDEIDLLVDWCGSRVEDSMLKEKETKKENLKPELGWHAIGDCVAPRTLEVAMAEAVQVARIL